MKNIRKFIDTEAVCAVTVLVAVVTIFSLIRRKKKNKLKQNVKEELKQEIKKELKASAST